MKGSPVRVRASALSRSSISTVPQEGLGGLEALGTVAAEIGRGLRKVDGRCERTFTGSLVVPRSSKNVPVTAFSVGAPWSENVCTGAWMRRRRRMSASARPTVRRCAPLSLHGAVARGVLSAEVAAGGLPLLLQAAAANPSTATASAGSVQRLFHCTGVDQAIPVCLTR